MTLTINRDPAGLPATLHWSDDHGTDSRRLDVKERELVRLALEQGRREELERRICGDCRHWQKHPLHWLGRCQKIYKRLLLEVLEHPGSERGAIETPGSFGCNDFDAFNEREGGG